MFDLSRLTEILEVFTGQEPEEFDPAAILQNLGDLGLDPSILEGLAPDEMLTALQEHGIDPSQFDAGQLAELSEQLGLNLPQLGPK